MKIAVIDAQGAGLGQTVIKRIRKEIPEEIYIIGLGTNTIATSNMVRAGANVGITGEKAICSFCDRQYIDCIIVPIGIICNHGVNSEISASIIQSIFQMDCIKYVMPLRKHNIFIPGTRNLEIKEIINEIIIDIKETLII
ncbi:DUF3842 family protein [Clostridium algidicarnis]|uniref:DUF3842 family protein n=1 Tax=Clostridium algidicarnis TaxID=37659 RepID=UPI001C0B7D06|nr:DUF3842 family protein [Clostridium algidicarnis]MBU3195256.1 DUF3842 family protein [Clostridium algidicarnis]MBU3208215.1 DUF3842 family protein [Clostridium algidicarnis]MBU3227553.1 DUF3842 family protein [Clostridium algidicarnis]MBU3251040.1 DUF3842 family protein [Clostridium algidicarnis]